MSDSGANCSHTVFSLTNAKTGNLESAGWHCKLNPLEVPSSPKSQSKYYKTPGSRLSNDWLPHKHINTSLSSMDLQPHLHATSHQVFALCLSDPKMLEVLSKPGSTPNLCTRQPTQSHLSRPHLLLHSLSAQPDHHRKTVNIYWALPMYQVLFKALCVLTHLIPRPYRNLLEGEEYTPESHMVSSLYFLAVL